MGYPALPKSTPVGKTGKSQITPTHEGAFQGSPKKSDRKPGGK